MITGSLEKCGLEYRGNRYDGESEKSVPDAAHFFSLATGETVFYIFFFHMFTTNGQKCTVRCFSLKLDLSKAVGLIGALKQNFINL